MVTRRMLPIVMTLIFAYASFNFLMLLKCLFENVEMRFPQCSCLAGLCQKKRGRKRSYDSIVEEEDRDLII